MKYFYSKEKQSKLVGSLAFNDDDIKEYMGGNPFVDYPKLNHDNTIISEILFERPTWTGTEIREMTREEICSTGDLSVLVDGEIWEDGQIKTIPKPQGVKIEWQYPEWVETATQSEVDWVKVNKEYNEYMQLANAYDTDLMKTQGVWEDFKKFIDECRTYISRVRKGISVLSSIPTPSDKLEEFFQHSFIEEEGGNENV